MYDTALPDANRAPGRFASFTLMVRYGTVWGIGGGATDTLT